MNQGELDMTNEAYIQWLESKLAICEQNGFAAKAAVFEKMIQDAKAK